MSLMQSLAKDESADIRVPREALMKRLDGGGAGGIEVAKVVRTVLCAV